MTIMNTVEKVNATLSAMKDLKQTALLSAEELNSLDDLESTVLSHLAFLAISQGSSIYIPAYLNEEVDEIRDANESMSLDLNQVVTNANDLCNSIMQDVSFVYSRNV